MGIIGVLILIGLITLFVLDCKKKIDVSGKYLSAALMILMPVAAGIPLINILFEENIIKANFILLICFGIIIISIAIFIRMNFIGYKRVPDEKIIY